MNARRKLLSDRKKNKLAQLFSTFDMSTNSIKEQQENFNLGLKLKSGYLSVPEIVRSISILGKLCEQGKISERETEDIKMDLVQRMTGYQIVKK